MTGKKGRSRHETDFESIGQKHIFLYVFKGLLDLHDAKFPNGSVWTWLAENIRKFASHNAAPGSPKTGSILSMLTTSDFLCS